MTNFILTTETASVYAIATAGACYGMASISVTSSEYVCGPDGDAVYVTFTYGDNESALMTVWVEKHGLYGEW